MSAEELAKWAELRKTGVVTDAEFEQKKAQLLQPDSNRSSEGSEPTNPTIAATPASLKWSDVKLRNKRWFQAASGLAAVLVGMIVTVAGAIILGTMFGPIAVLLMLFVPSFEKSGLTGVRVGRLKKAVMALGTMLLWVVLQTLVVGAGHPANSTVAADGVSTGQGQQSGADVTDSLAECTNPKVSKLAADAVYNVYDRAALPRNSGDVEALAKLVDLSSYNESYIAMRRSIAANSNDAIRFEDVRVCSPADEKWRPGFTVILARRGDRTGGFVMNFGIPGAVAKFGDDIDSD